jgi:hypothetical protein
MGRTKSAATSGNEDKPWELVQNSDYFRHIITNMDQCAARAHLDSDKQALPLETLSIRFGKTGKGKRPNYQITTRDNLTGVAVTTRFGSTNHREFKIQPQDTFDVKRISDPYHYQYVLERFLLAGGAL